MKTKLLHTTVLADDDLALLQVLILVRSALKGSKRPRRAQKDASDVSPHL